MSLVSNFQMMAKYNQRINEQLMACCQTLSSEELEKETQSFFPTIMCYWNHILFGDLILLGRLTVNNISSLTLSDFSDLPTPESPADIYHEKLVDIIVLRRRVDLLINKYCQNLTEVECNKFITYQSTEGETITKKVSDITQHMFNHQTHHRGQLTCILSQKDIDYGCMDLPIVVAEGSLN